MKGFRERLQNNEVIVFDGGVGTYLYEKGIFINTCFDELNLTNPDIVSEVHRDYITAGADVIETNTFGANRFKLAPHGLEPKVYEINLKGAQIAKAAAAGDVLVAGSVGPLGVQIEPLGKLSYDEAREAFKEQIKGLIDGGADLIVLETFLLVAELDQAIRAVKELNTRNPRHGAGDDQRRREPPERGHAGELRQGDGVERRRHARHELFRRAPGDARRPGDAQDAHGDAASRCSRTPVFPRTSAGRNIYMTSPEYMAEYAKRFIQTGATIVGGCCGTNPDHIRAIRRAVQALQPGEADGS